MKLSPPFRLILLTLFTTLIFWSIFYFRLPSLVGFPSADIQTLYANYDGPNYLIIAKCGYDFDCIRSRFSLPQPLEYYPAHLPGFPRLISLVNLVLPGPQAMLLTTLVGSVFLTLAFYSLAKLYLKKSTAFWLAVIFCFFPARLFILRQVGAPETWFLALTLISIYYFKKSNFWLSALMAAAAQTFKSPGILLFVAYALTGLGEFYSRRQPGLVVKKYYPFLLIPVSALMIFYGYYLQTGDFLAYFHSGDNFHLNLLPYLVFISNRSWIGSIWLEDIIYLYLLAFYGLYLLWRRYRFDIVTLYSFIFIVVTTLVAHRDISRYLVPAYPFLLLAFYRPLSRPVFRLLILILLPAILLYAVNFIIGNSAPVADWSPYL